MVIARADRMLRYAPLAFAVALAGPLLTVLNPGLFWDDWVWFYQSRAEHLKIGRELGIWWAGYLSNAIYALPEPTLTLRVTALIAWVLAGAAAAFTFRRLGLLSAREAFMVFLLFAVCHAGMIRFLNSVALYNVYIACFWIGCAILTLDHRSWKYRLLGLPFFYFSFHLNSLIVLYAAVPAALFIDHVRRDSELSPPPAFRALELLGGSEFRSWLRASALLLATRVTPRFLKRDGVLVILPGLFLLIVRIMRQDSALYGNYNEVRSDSALKGLLRASRELLDTFNDYVVSSWKGVSLDYLAIFVLVFALLALLLPRDDRTPRWRDVLATALLGLFLLYLGLVPYYIVGKPPMLYNYYESRHILPAIPGLVLMQVAILMAISIPLIKNYGWLARLARDGALVAFLALSANSALMSGYALMKDFTVQSAIEGFIEQNRDKLEPYRTFLFVDRTVGLRLGQRQIWNYEYTGTLVKAFGSKQYLGTALAEYISWTTKLPLLHVPEIRVRYNLDDYDPKRPHLVVEFRNDTLRPSFPRMIAMLRRHWRGEPVSADALAFVSFKVALEHTEAARRFADMAEIVAAMEAYKARVGYYPVNTSTIPPQPSAFGYMPVLVFSAPTRAAADAWITELAPDFIDYEKLIAKCEAIDCGYLYISDGFDYKLVYKNPQDLPYARQAYADHMDPRRDAYGYWTPGGAGW